MEKTLILVKPDGVKRGLIGKILNHFEDRGFKILNIGMFRLSREEAGDFYCIHRGKDFFEKLINHITQDRIVAVEVGGENAVDRVREIIGSTDPEEAEEGTIRDLYGLNKTDNTVHASDSQENAKREIEFFFGRED